MKKPFILLIIMIINIIMTLVLSGCGTDAQRVKVAMTIDPVTLDPRKVTDITAYAVVDNCMERLVESDSNHNIKPAGAERWQVSADGREYTFYLRKDAKWSNGEPVTAQDYAYAWVSALDPKFTNSHAEDFYLIKNGKQYNEGKCAADQVAVQALDDYTLKITLGISAPYFLEQLSAAFMSPVNHKLAMKNPHWADNAETYVSNGPYVLGQYQKGSKIVLNRNDKYRAAGTVKNAGVDIMICEDTNTKYAMFQSGQAAIVDVAPVSEYAELIKQGLVSAAPVTVSNFYIFNSMSTS